MVEQEAVNFEVAGSSPVPGATTLRGLFSGLVLRIESSPGSQSKALRAFFYFLDFLSVCDIMKLIFIKPRQDIVAENIKRTAEDIISEYEKGRKSEDCLYRNYKTLKEYVDKKRKETSNRIEILNRHFTNARKEGRKNFNEHAIRMFADWGYRFESYDFDGDSKLEYYAKKQRVVYCLTKFILVPIMACFAIGIIIGPFITPVIREISSNMSKNNTNPEDEKKENCASKLIKYAWDDEDGCQKINFSSKSDCLWATYAKSYYYDQDTHSYKKYYEYDFDVDLYKYNGTGINKYAVNDIPDEKMEFYITCSDDGNWHTNEVKNNISNVIRYWIDNAHTAVNGK